ncbi:DUF305 domain-containing protein [Rhodoferax koreense]|uniref:DUF305 domain-containing protein n=1 Tax=Rhodoferax koreensis TaxID=1842727 RepID=A0A1P8JTK9_9BURK|nr:DUF305 domain-containing protein [Rhodoferax koreense]APW37065.1 DUF305 domain-containing protein [Rhodoferax koreense]
MNTPRSFAIQSASAAIGLCLAVLTVPAVAQSKMDHGAHNAPAAPADASPSTKAFQASDEKMMKDMGVAYTGDADRDFVSHMIPHHEGAVAMAQVQLKYGKDPELRKMAQDIVKAQETEIAFMKKWQAKKGVK